MSGGEERQEGAEAKSTEWGQLSRLETKERRTRMRVWADARLVKSMIEGDEFLSREAFVVFAERFSERKNDPHVEGVWSRIVPPEFLSTCFLERNGVLTILDELRTKVILAVLDDVKTPRCDVRIPIDDQWLERFTKAFVMRCGAYRGVRRLSSERLRSVVFLRLVLKLDERTAGECLEMEVDCVREEFLMGLDEMSTHE